MDPLGYLEKYHNEAMAALSGEDIKIQPRKRLQHLDKMENSVRDLNIFREVFILNAVIARTRPAAANKQMAHLRTSYEKSRRRYKYEDFEAKIESYLGPVTFTPHGFMDRNLSGANEKDIFEGVLNLIDVVNGLGYQCFVNSGTLLGMVRSNGLIPHDDDIDLAVVLSSITDEDAAEEFKILMGMLLAEGLECRFVEGRNAIMKLPSVDGFEVDLFPAYGEASKFNIYPYARGTLTTDHIAPLLINADSKLPLPGCPEVLLEQNYGPGWKIPDPRFSFPWQQQKKAFKVLLDEMENDA